MAASSRSQVIGAIKVALPVTAFALLSTLFLFSSRPDPSAALPYTNVDVEELALEPRITQPHFTGITDDAMSYSIVADAAIPELDNPNQIATETVSVVVDGLGGDETLYVQAEKGDVNTNNRYVLLTGDVRLRSSLGITLNSEEMRADFTNFSMISPGFVTGSTPFGTVEAGRMEVTPRLEEASQLLRFEKDVKLVYQPSGA